MTDITTVLTCDECGLHYRASLLPHKCADWTKGHEQPRPEQAAGDSARGYDQCQYRYSIGAVCSIYRNCHPSGILNHDFVESPAPAAPEQSASWTSVNMTEDPRDPRFTIEEGDKLLATAYDAATAQRIITEHNLHSTLIEQQEQLAEFVRQFAVKGCTLMGQTCIQRKLTQLCARCRASQLLTAIDSSTTSGREG